MKKLKAVCVTPVDTIGDLKQRLSDRFDLIYLPDCDESELKMQTDVEVIFTNPNRSKVFFGPEVIRHLPLLKVICTASTGTVHIDTDYCDYMGVEVISIKRELPTLEKISSTAELAFTLTMMGIRHVPEAMQSVSEGQWDYVPFIGRQMSGLTIGVLGYGRLGKMYADYCKAFGSNVLVCDPWQEQAANERGFSTRSAEQLFAQSDVVSIHIHAEGNFNFVGQRLLKAASSQLVIVNTSRGEIVDEDAVAEFLKRNPNAKYATDVLASEYGNLSENPILQLKNLKRQVYVTPHIGGMSADAQVLAYGRAFDLLVEWKKNWRVKLQHEKGGIANMRLTH